MYEQKHKALIAEAKIERADFVKALFARVFARKPFGLARA